MKRLLPFFLGLFLPVAAFAQSTPGQVMTYQGPSLGQQWVLPSANTSAGVTGTGNAVFATSPTITAPNISGPPRTLGTVPVLSACGTSPAIVAASTNTAGQVTMGTGTPTGCVITFAPAFATAPFCVVTWQANIAAMAYTVSATAITLVQTATDSNIVNYHCIARSGG